jgi:hypothetical protein
LNGGNQLQQIEIDLRGDDVLTVYIDVFDNSLSRKWLASLDHLLANNYHLEKNYCFHGFVDTPRDGSFLVNSINESIAVINAAQLGYHIDDHFVLADLFDDRRSLDRERFNRLHRYFEDLQGVSGDMKQPYLRADAATRWHIRQLNLLCHEFESWALSYRKQIEAPQWQRPSQLMCWLHAPRFQLEKEDFELFGIDTMNRPLGGVYVGVNKAVGKHHWEVFCDEGRDSRIDELTTSTMRNQTEAAGDFDIEWANNPGDFSWQKENLRQFREWLVANKFDPEDPTLTIGHPQVGQVDLARSFGTTDYVAVWQGLSQHLDVVAVRTERCQARFDYHWSDASMQQTQIDIIEKGRQNEMA